MSSLQVELNFVEEAWMAELEAELVPSTEPRGLDVRAMQARARDRAARKRVAVRAGDHAAVEAINVEQDADAAECLWRAQLEIGETW